MAATVMTSSATARYSTVAILLHWLIAALLISNIGLAWYFNTLPKPDQVSPLGLHKSIGITVLLLSVIRLIWRFIAKPPPLPAYVHGWERWLSGTVQVIFYGLMIGLPLSGWATVSASPLIKLHPITLYGLVPWPAIGPLTHLEGDQMHEAHRLALTTHELLVKLAYATIVLHVAGALKHQFISRDDVVWRMFPILRRRRAGH